MTVPVHSLPGLRRWESHYHLAAEPGWAEEGHRGLAGVTVTQAPLEAAQGPTCPLVPLFLTLLSASCSQTHIPASARAWRESVRKSGKGEERQHRDLFMYQREISTAFALTFVTMVPECLLWAKQRVYAGGAERSQCPFFRRKLCLLCGYVTGTRPSLCFRGSSGFTTEEGSGFQI